MKRQLSVLAVFIAASLILAPSVLAAEKIGFINVSEVFDSYEKTKQEDAKLQAESETKRAEREKLVNDIKSLRDEIELMTPDARADKQRQMDEKVQELQAFDRDARLSLRNKRNEMIQKLLEEIDGVIQKYGDEKGYDYIYNDRVLVYKKDKNDLTKDIIKRLNG